MEKLNKLTKLRKAALITVVFWGIVLAIGGILNGNQMVVQRDLDHHRVEVLKEKINEHSLDCWVSSKGQSSRLTVVEFAEQGACTAPYEGVQGYECQSVENLRDLDWIRTNFPNRNREMIVFGSGPEQSLYIAALLSHYGYNVKMLERHQDLSNIKPVSREESPSEEQSVVTPVIESAVSDDEWDDDAWEEEGC